MKGRRSISPVLFSFDLKLWTLERLKFPVFVSNSDVGLSSVNIFTGIGDAVNDIVCLVDPHPAVTNDLFFIEQNRLCFSMMRPNPKSILPPLRNTRLGNDEGPVLDPSVFHFRSRHVHRQLATPFVFGGLSVAWDCVDAASDGFHPVPIDAPAFPKPLMWREFNPVCPDDFKIIRHETCHTGVFDAFPDLSTCPLSNIHKNTGAEQLVVPAPALRVSMAYPRRFPLPVVLGICQVMKRWQSFCRVDREGISRSCLRRFAPKTCYHRTALYTCIPRRG